MGGHPLEATVDREDPFHQQCLFPLGYHQLGAVVVVAFGAADSRFVRNLDHHLVLHFLLQILLQLL